MVALLSVQGSGFRVQGSAHSSRELSAQEPGTPQRLRFTLSSGGVGGSGHGYNSLLKLAVGARKSN